MEFIGKLLDKKITNTSIIIVCLLFVYYSLDKEIAHLKTQITLLKTDIKEVDKKYDRKFDNIGNTFQQYLISKRRN